MMTETLIWFLSVLVLLSWAVSVWMIAENGRSRKELRRVLAEQRVRLGEQRNLVRFWKREAEQAQVAATDARRARVEIRAQLRVKVAELAQLHGELERARLATLFSVSAQPRKRDDREISTVIDGGVK